MEPTIARYEIIAELGHGALATVYRARDPRLEREVAIKLLRPEYLSDLGFRRRFEQEATMIAALAHPAIIPVYEFGQHEGQLYLVMAYMPNGSLAGRLAQGPLAPEAAEQILRRVGGALDFAHENGIVHRDLKPSNILFDEEDNAYLGDFGIALQAAAREAGSAAISGTPAYMSPEQARRDAGAGSASDLYALAVTAYQMVAGKLPFAGDSPVSVLLQHLNEPPPPLRDVAPDLPASLDAVLQAALAKDPARRYPSAAAFVDAFAAALAHPEAPPRLPAPAATAGERQPAMATQPAPPVPPGPSPVGDERQPQMATQPSPPLPEPVGTPRQMPVAPVAEAGSLQRARAALVARPLLAFALVTVLAVAAAALAVALKDGERSPAVAETEGEPATISRPLATAEPGDSSEEVEGAAAGSEAEAAAAQEAALQLVYDEARLTVINAGSAPVGIGNISFYRAATESVPEAAFGAGEWGGVAGNAVNALPPGECFQLVNLGATGNPGPAAPEGCSRLRGWIGTRRLARLPFAGDGAASFDVRRGEETLATCPLAAGSCRVALP